MTRPVIDFDFVGSHFRESFSDPAKQASDYEEFIRTRDRIAGEMRASCPVAYTDHSGGYWVVTRLENIKQIVGDTATFSSARNADGTGGIVIPPIGDVALLPGECDAPMHKALRKVLNPLFTRRSIDALRPSVAELVSSCLDGIIAKRDFDVCTDLALRVPPTVIVRYLGIPDGDRDEIVDSIRASHTVDGADHAAGPSRAEIFATLSSKLLGHVRAARTDPQNNVIGRLVTASENFDDQVIMANVIALATGGIETTNGLVANAMLHMHRDHILRDALIADPLKIPVAAEEFLRHYSPSGGVARTVTRDVMIGGVEFARGERVWLALPSANHDESRFPDPELIQTAPRRTTPHVAFGFGPHFCVGVWLARLEIDVILTQVLARIPRYHIDDERAIRSTTTGGLSNQWQSMPATTNLLDTGLDLSATRL